MPPDCFWRETLDDLAWRIRSKVYERALERYNLGVLISAVTAPYTKRPLPAESLLSEHERRILGIVPALRALPLSHEQKVALHAAETDAEFFAILRGDEPSPEAPWLDAVAQEVVHGE